MRLIVALASLIGLFISPVFGGENDYIFVDRMPQTLGELQRTLTYQDEQDGLEVEQTLFAEDFAHALVQTFVMTAHCPDEGAGQTSMPKIYIMAIKYPPKNPATFAVARLHDIYKEVYVTDRNGKIRLYEDVAPQSMLDLSETFKPTCIRI